MSATSGVNNFWITIKRSKVESKGSKPVLAKGVFKSKEEPDGIIRLKSRNLVKGYIQAPGVEYTDSSSPD